MICHLRFELRTGFATTEELSTGGHSNDPDSTWQSENHLIEGTTNYYKAILIQCDIQHL